MPWRPTWAGEDPKTPVKRSKVTQRVTGPVPSLQESGQIEKIGAAGSKHRPTSVPQPTLTQACLVMASVTFGAWKSVYLSPCGSGSTKMSLPRTLID